MLFVQSFVYGLSVSKCAFYTFYAAKVQHFFDIRKHFMIFLIKNQKKELEFARYQYNCPTIQFTNRLGRMRSRKQNTAYCAPPTYCGAGQRLVAI